MISFLWLKAEFCNSNSGLGIFSTQNVRATLTEP